MSLASPGFASNAHSSTPRLSRRLVAVGGVVDGSISTTMSSFSLTGNWSSIAIRIGKSWPLRTLVLNARSSVFDVVTIRPAEPSLRLTHGALDLDLVVGAEAEPHRLVLAGGRHLAAADKHAVAIDRDPAGQQRRVLGLLEARFEERGRDR